jgi:hypothetical protein
MCVKEVRVINDRACASDFRALRGWGLMELIVAFCFMDTPML